LGITSFLPQDMSFGYYTERLKAQQLSREREADQLVYNWFAERETNVRAGDLTIWIVAVADSVHLHGLFVVQTIVEDVLLDLVYDITEESFDEVERESGKKELPPDQLEVVMEALTTGPMERVLIQKYAVDITRRHLQCLHPLQWLNDEVRESVVVEPKLDNNHSTYLHA